MLAEADIVHMVSCGGLLQIFVEWQGPGQAARAKANWVQLAAAGTLDVSMHYHGFWFLSQVYGSGGW